jgi:hypothetical protein
LVSSVTPAGSVTFTSGRASSSGPRLVTVTFSRSTPPGRSAGGGVAVTCQALAAAVRASTEAEGDAAAGAEDEEVTEGDGDTLVPGDGDWAEGVATAEGTTPTVAATRIATMLRDGRAKPVRNPRTAPTPAPQSHKATQNRPLVVNCAYVTRKEVIKLGLMI